MISYNLNHSHEIDKTFSDYLITIPRFVNNYNSLLDALKHLNKNQEKKPIVFIKSKCSDKIFACLYCSDKDYDSSIKDIENIIQLHIFKKKHIEQLKNENIFLN